MLKAKRDDEFARLQKNIVELLKKTKSVANDEDDEGTDPRLTLLKTCFSAVKVKYFRQILDNKFDPLNISRLYNDVTISRSYKAKYIDLGKNIEVKMKEEDATKSDIKGLTFLLRGFFVYFQIQLHFTEDANHQSLSAAYYLYQGRLCIHYAHYTWELIRSFHISFHQTAINKGVRDPLIWSKIDTTLENTIFFKQDKSPDSTNAKRGALKTLGENKEKPVCF